MRFSLVFIAGIVIVGAFIDSAHAIKCYVCDSSTDNCNDQFNPNGIHTRSGCQSCMKIKGEAYGQKVVQRQCVDTGRVDQCVDTNVGALHVTGTTCLCTTDLCNGAARLGHGVVPLTLVLFAIIKLF